MFYSLHPAGQGLEHGTVNTDNVFEELSQLCAAQQSACLAAAGMRALALDVVKMQFLFTSVSIRSSPEVNWMNILHHFELNSLWIGHFF